MGDCEKHRGIGCKLTQYRIEAIQARNAGNEELARKCERQAEILEDSLVIYHLWTPWRSRLPREEALKVVHEIEAEGRVLLSKISQTSCPVCLRHLTDEVEHLKRKLEVLIEEHINAS